MSTSDLYTHVHTCVPLHTQEREKKKTLIKTFYCLLRIKRIELTLVNREFSG